MNTKEKLLPVSGIAIPSSILEKKVDDNSFALLRLFVRIVGIDAARIILETIAQQDLSQKLPADIAQNINLLIYEQIRLHFPSLSELTDDKILMEADKIYNEANSIITSILTISFPGMNLQLGLSNTTDNPQLNFAERLARLYDPDFTTDRFKFEILRQDVLALLLLSVAESNHVVETTEVLNDINLLFENKLYAGKMGDLHLNELYSVHSNDSNECLSIHRTIEEAQLVTNTETNTHIKHNAWNTRYIQGVGFVLANMRRKKNFSIIRKAMSAAQSKPEQRGYIDVSNPSYLLDTMGYMFVTPEGTSQELFAEVCSLIQSAYPTAEMKYKHLVGTNVRQGQSEKVQWLRCLFYLPEQPNPIEIVVMEQKEYLDYTLELDEAHELYNIRKSEAAAKILVPQTVFNYNPAEAKQKFDKNILKIKRDLLKKNRVETQA
ncbi:MAG: hypothetical protein GW762_05790 [Candidatus Pacebacteria bacterium]|nr:hypothetical protein [Candidatus Paceibacterota bacterium]PIR63505.1 MAG: hypothetical protein COU64_04220 [Candidatus Pacebacteria bacterium CG10_big_fil_rev_8_21_14_0_10_40_26]PIZ78294.1 MAG: hypothetical protein COY01_05950 [Candidatus Pacebacteria bacterium CG_4_10_14_0_2_um_filter_40_20]PJA68661.1 MAG: hypothetical protein CO156_04095 [Candidatus Pacebacteria bacterium CG_4_9_14_3_um_filter_40_12]PJC41601.1 MAG: hypothetical protein CO041_02685 [Candidatus Pacebacteria bacterium CG_4_9_